LNEGESTWQNKAFENLQIVQLEENIPNLIRILDFKLSEGYYLNWKSLKNAPAIECIDTASTILHYRFVDLNRAGKKREYFYPSTLEKPFVKYIISNGKRQEKVKELSNAKFVYVPASSRYFSPFGYQD